MSKIEYNLKCRGCLFEEAKEFELSTINFINVPSSEIEYVDILAEQNDVCPNCGSKNQDYFNLKIENKEICVSNEIDHFILSFNKTNGESSTIKTGGTTHRYHRNDLFRKTYRKIYETIESIPKENLLEKDDGLFEIIITVHQTNSNESIELEKLRYFGYSFDGIKTIINSLGQFI